MVSSKSYIKLNFYGVTAIASVKNNNEIMFFFELHLSMKNSLVLLFLFNTLAASSQKNNWFSIKAFLPHWNGAEINLFQNNQLLYTSKVTKDMFAFTGSIDMASQGSLKISKGKIIFYIPVFLEPGTIKVRDAGGRVLVSYGTVSNDMYVQLNNSFDSLTAQKKDLSFSEALNYKRELATQFISNNPSSIVSVQLLKDYYYLATETNDSLYYALMHALDTLLQKTYYATEMLKEANARYITAIGQKAPLLQLPDTSGLLSSLYKSGQYTLLDFSASWCVPCRKENPALVKIFEKYHHAGFNITGISLDANKRFWLTAIKHDKLIWQQLSDLKGWSSHTAEVYGIKVIPMNYLLNSEGTIIAKNLHAGRLEILLEGLLRKSNSN